MSACECAGPWLQGQLSEKKVFGRLPPGGGANLRACHTLGGGSDPPSTWCHTLGGGSDPPSSLCNPVMHYVMHYVLGCICGPDPPSTWCHVTL